MLQSLWPALLLLCSFSAHAAAPAPRGFVRVEADINPSQIWLDGQNSGVTTPGLLENVVPGTHTITVKSDGCWSKTSDTVQAGQVSQVQTTIKSGWGTVHVSGTPEKAQVLIDGKPVQVLEEGMKVACGSHPVKVVYLGFQHYDAELKVTHGEHTTLEFALQPLRYGQLTIVLDDESAEYSIDGTCSDQGSTTLAAVPVGPHTIRSRSRQVTVQVLPDKVTVARPSQGRWTQSAEELEEVEGYRSAVCSKRYQAPLPLRSAEADPYAPPPVEAAPVLKPLRVKRKVQPSYPKAAREMRLGDHKCKARIAVDAKGLAQEVEIQGCPTVFHESVRRTLLQWTFYPATKNGTRVPATFKAVIAFRLL